MRPKSFVLLALALGCGLVASIGISQVMEGNKNQGTEMETTSIYVALHNINLGDPIDATMISLQEWPKDKVPQGVLTALEDVEGRRPRTNIIAGEPILDAKLLGQDETSDPLAGLGQGMRIATIGVDAENSASGLLSPGDRVDIQVFIRADHRSGIMEPTTKIFLQNIRVFAIEQSVQRAPEGGEARSIPKTVSLLVTPEQATKIDFARRVGELSIIPRSPNDETMASDASIGLQDIIGNGSEKNTREKEQDRDRVVEEEKKPKTGLFSGLVSMMKKTAKDRPPFEMELIQADEVSVERFDPNTGKPMRESKKEQETRESPSVEERATVGATSGGSIDTPGDFPIDFDFDGE